MPLKKCDKGHLFPKTSDCPACPVCEKERMHHDSFLDLLSAPARRALEQEGILTIEMLASYTEKQILKLHGMGKATIPKLKEFLEQSGKSFKP